MTQLFLRSSSKEVVDLSQKCCLSKYYVAIPKIIQDYPIHGTIHMFQQHWQQWQKQPESTPQVIRTSTLTFSYCPSFFMIVFIQALENNACRYMHQLNSILLRGEIVKGKNPPLSFYCMMLFQQKSTVARGIKKDMKHRTVFGGYRKREGGYNLTLSIIDT